MELVKLMNMMITERNLYDSYETARTALHFADKFIKGEFKDENVNKK
jgi:hypothetical protein